MAGTIKLDGTTFLTKSGSTFTQTNTTLGSDVVFPTGMVLKVYYAEVTAYPSTYADDAWRTILSITTDAPASTNSDFILTGHLTYGVDDWGIKTRFFNTTTSTAISINTNTGIGNRIQGSWTSSGGTSGTNRASEMFLCSGVARQTNNTGVAQTFSMQAYSGRGSFYINRSYSISSDDDISDQLGTTAFYVMEVA